MPTELYTLGILGGPRHDVRCRRTNHLIAPRAAVVLGRRRARERAHVPVTIRMGLDARARDVLPRLSRSAPILPPHAISLPKSEESGSDVGRASELLVVEDHTADTPILRESPCLRLDLLGREDTFDRSEEGIPIEELEVAG